MIIKQTRIPTAEHTKLASYLFSEGENEKIAIMQGQLDSIEFHALRSDITSYGYCTRHIILSPGRSLKAGELKTCVAEVAKEFKMSSETLEATLVVVHKKKRGAGEASEFHYHIAVPELDPVTMKPLDAEFIVERNEKVVTDRLAPPA